MAASNTPVFDLIELSGIHDNATYTRAPGGGGDILGVVENATYSDSDASNSSTNVAELNQDYGGKFVIDGITYQFTMAVPDSGSDVVTVFHDGGTTNLSGGGGTSQVVFLQMWPLGGGAARYFVLVDDTVGDLQNITAIQVRTLDYTVAGNDVSINADRNNAVTVCFALGTRIATPLGSRPVEVLTLGDLVDTLDHGPRPIRWCYRRRFDLSSPAEAAARSPVRLAPGALGPGVPDRALVLSPQHRVMIASPIAARMFGTAEVLVPAVKLVGHPGIERVWPRSVSYVHLHLGQHEIVMAEGAPTESLLRAPMSLSALPPLRRWQLARLPGGADAPARPIVEGRRAIRTLLRRHLKNGKPLLMPSARQPVGLRSVTACHDRD